MMEGGMSSCTIDTLYRRLVGDPQEADGMTAEFVPPAKHWWHRLGVWVRAQLSALLTNLAAGAIGVSIGWLLFESDEPVRCPDPQHQTDESRPTNIETSDDSII
jgi:hypothetical protein